MIRLSHYEEHFHGLTFRFEFIRFAFKSLSMAKRQAFVKKCRDRDLSNTDKQTVDFLSMPQIIETLGNAMAKDIAKSVADSTKRKIRAKYRFSDLRFYEEDIDDRINQSELLLLVAYFESFLKEFHAELLSADPKLIPVSKPERTVMLEQVLGRGFKDFVRGEIALQIKQWDKDGIESRAKLFQKIQINFGDKLVIQKLKSIFGFRNRISHELSLSPTDLEKRPVGNLDDDGEPSTGTIVPANVMTDARLLLLSVPSFCIDQAAKRFPSHFGRR